MKNSFFSLCIFLLPGLASATYFHLEAGAGNYGQEGHTRKALFTTYSANEVTIKNETSFFEGITENASQGVSPLKPEIQYRVLFQTLDELVKRHPNELIVFHVNDLVPDWAQYASDKLAEYAFLKGYNVVIEPVGGNYFLLDSSKTLASYRVFSYDSVHLKNAELMYSQSIDGRVLVVTNASRQRMREGLQRLANLSKSGLHFFILNTDDYFPHFERREYSMQGKFYLNSTEWSGYGYDLPDGLWSAPERLSHVFFIKANHLN